jgi:hypothetical protein
MSCEKRDARARRRVYIPVLLRAGNPAFGRFMDGRTMQGKSA